MINDIKCETCVEALVCNKLSYTKNSLISKKDRGGLIYPSNQVTVICKRVESVFRVAENVRGGKIIRFSIAQIVSRVLKSFLGLSLFPDLKDHMLDDDSISNHVIHLSRAIATKYLNIRFHYFSKKVQTNHDSFDSFIIKLVKVKGQ